MLKKENRLNSYSAYQATYNNNKVVSDKLIVLYIGKEKINKDYPTRVGFVVSKKIHKRAIKRNRIKRLMREAFRQIFLKNSCNIVNDYQSFILIARNEILNRKYFEVQNSINNLLNKIANKNI